MIVYEIELIRYIMIKWVQASISMVFAPILSVRSASAHSLCTNYSKKLYANMRNSDIAVLMIFLSEIIY